MLSFRELFESDLERYGPDKAPGRYTKSLLRYFRRIQTCKNKYLRLYYRARYRLLCRKRAMEIPPFTKIGEGLYLGHVYNITINEDAVIGKNCNIHKGVLIGQTNRGANKGVPVIGNDVWIGVNAAIVGGITVGDDVLIAPNSFVNCDIPSHSVVFGNPCIIKHKDNATDCYIEFKC